MKGFQFIRREWELKLNKKRLFRKSVLPFLLLCMVQTINHTTVPVAAALVQEIRPMADKFEWKYKIINGKRYKRLYNVTKHSWVGDWIPV